MAETDIEDFKAEIAAGRSVKEAAEFLITDCSVTRRH
jgi:hypothetical protein